MKNIKEFIKGLSGGEYHSVPSKHEISWSTRDFSAGLALGAHVGLAAAWRVRATAARAEGGVLTLKLRSLTA